MIPVYLKNSLRSLYRWLRPVRAERVLGVEFVNICNLHCAYCFRDEDMLYGKAHYLDVARLFGLIDSMPKTLKPISISLTGGEPLLHPRFGEVVRGLDERRVRFKVVTNGWHFDRVYEDLRAARKRLTGISFSVDGATREAHDAYRGAGSFDRVMKALALCDAARLPFQFNIVLRTDTVDQMERIAVLAARLGARAVNFGAMLPTSVAAHRRWGLSRAQEMEARREVTALAKILSIPVRVLFGLYDDAPGAHCSPLNGRALTLDYKGQLRLCGNLSSFRGAVSEGDVPEGASSLFLEEGWTRIGHIGAQALRRRDDALAKLPVSAGRPDPILGSPCLSCLSHFDKLHPDLRATLLAPMKEVVA